MIEKIQIGLFTRKQTLIDKILGRKKPVPVFMRDKPPFFHYEIKSGENKGAFTTIPVTQTTESFANRIWEERQMLISQGLKVISYSIKD